MFNARPAGTIPAAFTLPIRLITVGDAGSLMAVHVAGRLDSARVPLICIAGYQRNMSDFTDFTPLFQRLMATDWPVVLIDLRGRGRSAYRARGTDYASTNDARDVSAVVRALGIESAIFVGQGYGGQVIMALGAERPTAIAGAVLIDAGPVTAARGLVRMRSNLRQIDELRGASGLRTMFRKMLAADYPGADEAQLDRLTGRAHSIEADGRAQPLFDAALIKLLDDFGQDDILVPQWPLFDTLMGMPLMFLRTQLTDQLSPEILDAMMERRPDATSFIITNQGSPALLDHVEDAAAIAEFVHNTVKLNGRTLKRA
jgi:pimeloyl-ACP methyl ester carboxylesterase